MMNFSEFARSGTAPSSKSKSSVVNASLFTVRPRTRAGDGTINDLNVELRTNKTGGEQTHSSQDKSDDFISFKKRQENEEYLKAMESFHAAVDNWSGKKDNGDGKRPESRSRVSKDPNKKQSLYMSGLSAYTQNVPSILLQPSKRGMRNPVGTSPRARDKSTNNHINELRAAYGADFVGSGLKSATVKPKAVKPHPPTLHAPIPITQDALRYQEDVQATAQLRSSSAHKPSAEPFTSGGSNRPQTQASNSRQGTHNGDFDGRDHVSVKRASKKAALVTQGAPRSVNKSGSSGATPSAGSSIMPRDALLGKTTYEPFIDLPPHSVNSAAVGNRMPDAALSYGGFDIASELPSRSIRDPDRTLPGHAGGGAILFGASSQGNLLSPDNSVGTTTSVKRKESRAVHSGQKQQRNIVNIADGDAPEGSSAARKVASLTLVTDTEPPPSVIAGLPVRESTMVTSSQSLALERPQSRKLYLGNEKSGSNSASKPTTKAPKSAGARYSNFSPSRGPDADDASDPFLFRQGSLKRMSSFNGFSGGTQLAASRGPWLEEDHLPVRRPPSRQSSAFPVHLADAPAMPATEGPGDAEVDGARGPSSSSSIKARRKEERAAGDANALSASPSAVLVGSESDQHTGDDAKLMHRPPSRQKLAAQHLFEGMRGSHQSGADSDAAEHIVDEREVRSHFRHGAVDAQISKLRPDTIAGNDTVSRGRSSAATPRTGLFYNPRDDGFLELQDTNGVGGSVLPFTITVNYGPDAEAPDYTVVAAEALRGNPQSRASQSSRAAQHGRRGESIGPPHHRKMDSLDSATERLSDAASELSLIDLASAVVPLSSRGYKDARRISGNRPASGSWESVEVEGSGQVRVRPKTVTALPFNGSKGTNNGNYVVSQTSHAHSRNRFSGEPLVGAGSRSRVECEGAESLQQRSILSLSNTAGQKGTAWTADSISLRKASSALGFSPDVGSPGSKSAMHSSARHLSDSPATFSDVAARAYIQDDENEEGEGVDEPGWFDSSRQGDREDDMTIMTEDSGRSGGSPLSIHSFTLESSLGEDFLNLFAPGGR